MSIYISAHFARSISRRSCDRDLLASGCSDMFRRLSSCSSSWNNSFTLWSVLADVSMKAHFHCLASAPPSAVVTSRSDAVSSDLLPTSITGMLATSAPRTVLISVQIGRSSSRDCRLTTEYTRINAWPLEIDKRCIAGNWWLPVVSVICSVHTCTFDTAVLQRVLSRDNRSTDNKITRPFVLDKSKCTKYSAFAS